MCNTGPEDPPAFLSAWFSSTSFQFWGSLGNLPKSQTYKQQAWGGMGSICLLAFVHHLEDSRPPGVHRYVTKNLFYKTHVWNRAAVHYSVALTTSLGFSSDPWACCVRTLSKQGMQTWQVIKSRKGIFTGIKVGREKATFSGAELIALHIWKCWPKH